MLQSIKMTAEEQFAAIQKKAKKVLDEKEELEQERADHVAKLRAMRLAKETADREAAEQTAIIKAAAKKVAAKKK